MPSALVIGGSSGIGFAIARMLRDEGHDLTLVARKVERLEEAAADLAATAVAADVRHEEDCARIVASHLDAHGGLDVLVNSAGVGIAATIGDTSTKHWDLQQSVNLRGAFLVTREALPALREAKGYVVNLASIAGTMPTPGLATYAAAKAALESLSRSLAREEADTGVRVTAICPAYVDTPMTTWTRIDGELMIQPEDCAELVRSLLRMSPAARVAVVVIERAGDVI
ncbi:MAG TPA: SDR family oxidoreductase [Gaiella sp.]|nr:SDR family oxidoreductase [Gaiella sp.]